MTEIKYGLDLQIVGIICYAIAIFGVISIIWMTIIGQIIPDNLIGLLMLFLILALLGSTLLIMKEIRNLIPKQQ